MFKKVLIIFGVVCLVCLIMSRGVVVEARQGCCSGHGGVCGCQCCDGSRLSAVCSPYYPECESVAKFHDSNEANPSILTSWWVIALLIGGVSFVAYFAKIRYKR